MYSPLLVLNLFATDIVPITQHILKVTQHLSNLRFIDVRDQSERFSSKEK